MPGDRTLVVIEVTNTLLSPSVTGYQRFVRELLAQLQAPGTPDVEVLPVAWDTVLGAHRRLTPAEASRMSTAWTPVPAGGLATAAATSPTSPTAARSFPQRAVGRATRQARQVAGGARRRARADPRVVRALAAARARRPAALTPRSGLRVTVPRGAVWLDLEPAWHNPAKRAQLLPELKARGVHVVTVVADVMPELYPQWFDQRVARLFHDWLHAHLATAELALSISENTKLELQQVAARDGFAAPPTTVIPMGADFTPPETSRAVALPPALGRYLLVVGTVEPRKNHALVLDLLDRISDDHPDVGVVVVGKKGWLIQGMLERMHGHPLWERRLVWLSGIGDDELTWLYEHAFLALAPSFSEGLGLPVMEALSHGVPTISSNGGALPEAGGQSAEYAAPDDLDAWEALVRAHLEDPSHHRAARARAAAHTAPSWRDTGAAVRQAVTQLTEDPLR